MSFEERSFDLVTSRHPVRVRSGPRSPASCGTTAATWPSVGPESAFELVEQFLGPLSDTARRGRHPDVESAQARAAGLVVEDLRTARLRMEFFDIGAILCGASPLSYASGALPPPEC